MMNELPESIREFLLAERDKRLLFARYAPASPSIVKWDARPSSIPLHISKRPASIAIPEYPELGLDHPDARGVWEQAHLRLAKARYMLEPKVLRAYSEAQLEVEKWQSRQRGRKPSGDLRYPVPRNRLSEIATEMIVDHEGTIASANREITAISAGDVADVKIEKLPGSGTRSVPSFPFLILQSDLDRRTANCATREELTDEQREFEDVKWEQLIEELLAELPRVDPDLEILYFPELPRDRDPTDAEVRNFVTAVKVHIDYVDKGLKIEAKRKADTTRKIRTQKRLEAETADPEGAAAAKKEVARTKAADRQRRFRERQKIKGIE